MVKIIDNGEIAKALGFTADELRYIKKLTIVVEAGHIPIVIIEKYTPDSFVETLIRRIRLADDDTGSQAEETNSGTDGADGGALHTSPSDADDGTSTTPLYMQHTMHGLEWLQDTKCDFPGCIGECDRV